MQVHAASHTGNGLGRSRVSRTWGSSPCVGTEAAVEARSFVRSHLLELVESSPRVPGWGAIEGWVQIPIFPRNIRLKVGDARVWSPKLVVAFARGGTTSLDVRALALPTPTELGRSEADSFC